MLEFLSLITKENYWIPHSRIMRAILKCYGIETGKNFCIKGIPKLKIRGRAKNIIIGDNVSILGNIDIRNRENGKLIIENDVIIEQDCRFVAARDGAIIIGKSSVIGAFAVFNGGADIKIGKQCIFAVRASINANDHLMARKLPIRDQGFMHAPVIIEDDCWFGTNVSIHKGVNIKKGSIIGANAVVTKDTDPYSINVGIPAKKIGERN
jgi:acetyltransferase-like isoleucine patch superfamily enzyme